MPSLQSSDSRSHWWDPVETARRTGIDRTRTGVLLVILGIILGPIPYLNYIGILTAIIGVIMVILGRDQFGSSHSRDVITSVVVYCVGIVISFITGLVFGFSIVQVSLRGGGQALLIQSLTDAFNGLLIHLLVSGTVLGVAYVLFTYALQDSSGRLLLYVAFALQLVFGVLAAYIVSGQVASAVSQSFASGSFDPSSIRALQSQLQYLQLLGLIPGALFAISYYRAYSRISKGEIPRPPTTLGPVVPC